MSDYRTQPGDVLRDPQTGRWRDVVAVYRAEDIARMVNATCYRHRPDERSALYGGSRGTTWRTR